MEEQPQQNQTGDRRAHRTAPPPLAHGPASLTGPTWECDSTPWLPRSHLNGGLPHSVLGLRDTRGGSEWVLEGGPTGQVRPNLTLLFLTLLACSHSLSITWKSWAPETGGFHCCCHRSGIGGVSSVRPLNDGPAWGISAPQSASGPFKGAGGGPRPHLCK